MNSVYTSISACAYNIVTSSNKDAAVKCSEITELCTKIGANSEFSNAVNTVDITMNETMCLNSMYMVSGVNGLVQAMEYLYNTKNKVATNTPSISSTEETKAEETATAVIEIMTPEPAPAVVSVSAPPAVKEETPVVSTPSMEEDNVSLSDKSDTSSVKSYADRVRDTANVPITAPVRNTNKTVQQPEQHMWCEYRIKYAGMDSSVSFILGERLPVKVGNSPKKATDIKSFIAGYETSHPEVVRSIKKTVEYITKCDYFAYQQYSVLLRTQIREIFEVEGNKLPEMRSYTCIWRYQNTPYIIGYNVDYNKETDKYPFQGCSLEQLIKHCEGHLNSCITTLMRESYADSDGITPKVLQTIETAVKDASIRLFSKKYQST